MATQIVRKFDSFHAMIRYAEGDGGGPDIRRKSREEGTYWFGTENFDEATKLALHGWSEARPEIDLITSRISSSVREVTELAFQPVHDVQGAMVDVGAFLAGEPECMVDFLPMEQSRVGRVVTVIAQTSVSAAVSTETIMARGAALAALVESLAVAQHSVELWVELAVGNTDARSKADYWACLVKVKEASERFDVDAFSFALAHPSMFRRLVFSCMEREDEATRRKFGFYRGQGYGRVPSECTQAENVGADVVINGTGPSAKDLDQNPVKWITDIMRDLGLGESE